MQYDVRLPEHMPGSNALAKWATSSRIVLLLSDWEVKKNLETFSTSMLSIENFVVIRLIIPKEASIFVHKYIVGSIWRLTWEATASCIFHPSCYGRPVYVVECLFIRKACGLNMVHTQELNISYKTL